jgi:hypothetical protein
LAAPAPVFNTPPKVIADVVADDPAPPESDGAGLSAGQTTQVSGILAADARLQQLLAGKQYSVDGIGPWTTGGETYQLVGSLVIIRLAQPASFPSSSWPVVEYAGEDATAYTETTVQFAADGVTELMVNVDLGKGRVVGIQPDGDDVRITPDPGTPTDDPAQR